MFAPALRDVEGVKRTARYVTVLVLSTPGRGPDKWCDESWTGVTEGRIALTPSGSHGFGYDPLFISNELGITFGEAGDAEKARVSHRARAVEHARVRLCQLALESGQPQF